MSCDEAIDDQWIVFVHPIVIFAWAAVIQAVHAAPFYVALFLS